MQWLGNLLQRGMGWLEAPGRTPLAAARRLLLTLGTVLILGILPWHIDAGRARWWAPAALGLITLLFLAGVGVGQKIGPRLMGAIRGESRLQLWSGKISLSVPALGIDRGLELFWKVLQRVGILMPALMFFIFWALIYISAWAWNPIPCTADPVQSCSGAFGGLGENPIFGDFLYYAVNMAFANPVPDVIGRSHWVHSLNTVEVMSGIGLASLYAGAFFGLKDKTPDPGPTRRRSS